MIICILDGDRVTDKETLHDTLTSSLQLPDWYGRNLDALYDCLSDIHEDTEIRVLHHETLENHLGRYAQVLWNVMHKVCHENPHIHFTKDTSIQNQS